ncbi:uncharacterized protein [Spinacia oleracea]|uniref:DUF4218 domain-containing protein n=1 Tax=Spinacia oleracea TaxID=3562 RepID=A0ABM3RRE3_SPIOL|nr:uncharacterized protein LOC110788236 [Spinacia oleracea]
MEEGLDVDYLEEMTHILGQNIEGGSEMFESLSNDAKTAVYHGCTKFSKLSVVLKLYNLKARGGVPDDILTSFLKLVKEMLPAENVLPDRNYEARKMLSSVGMVPKFRHLFSIAEEAKKLTWHADERLKDGLLRHPADSPQWIKIDNDFEDFGSEDRNLHLALAADGMNPFGPKQPGNDIDVYLAPLIEDLKMMWDSGIQVFDAHRNENFNLKALLYGTINDFPAYGNLAGYSVNGYEACPICEENTFSPYLNFSHKNVYPGFRKFFPIDHQYRRWKKAFNGETEEGTPPVPPSGDEILQKMQKLDVNLGKLNAKNVPSTGHKKLSIFFDLLYWRTLHVRHFLDVIHIEKNVCESLISTLLNVPGKTRDGEAARLDLVDLEIRAELAPIKRNSRTYMPQACYTLSRKEKISFCECLYGVKVPEGYSSNIKTLVSMKNLKLIGLKSHDYHILMEHLLPVAIRSILPEPVRNAITKLCIFFSEICSKEIDPLKLSDLQRDLVITLCQLEMFFPPSFFDIMIHLTVHLVREVQLCGPAYLRYMYAVERFMKILKGYVHSGSRPEGCIVERTLIEEALEFCIHYLSNVDAIRLPKPRDPGGFQGKGIVGKKMVSLSHEQWHQAHLYVLHNSTEVDPYVKEHMLFLTGLHPRKSKQWIAEKHNRSFIEWLRVRIYDELAKSPLSISDILKWLSRGPCFEVMSYSGYKINSYTFYTKDRDKETTMKNNGVAVLAEVMHISSAKDKNPIYAKMTYYGVIPHI